MKTDEQTSSSPKQRLPDIQDIIALAHHYDQLGQFNLADKLFNYILNNYVDQLPTETQLSVRRRSNPQSMSSTEDTRGFIPVRYGPMAFTSGKGGPAFRDKLPLNQEFV